MVDHVKTRREQMRWELIRVLDKSRPHTSSEVFLLGIMQAIFRDATALEVRRELDYLAARDLVELVKESSGMWYADLSRHGVDIAEYTIDCAPGIARPVKYWSE
ncbi:MAG: hypothetical protein Q4A97_10800 [Comamonadaceae bacterium]|nr:hypothetical protein [Comamonadaceae bacterium]